MKRLPSMAVRATLDQAAAVASSYDPPVRVVVIIMAAGKGMIIVADPADVAELPDGLRRAVESSAADKQPLCPKCGGHGA